MRAVWYPKWKAPALTNITLCKISPPSSSKLFEKFCAHPPKYTRPAADHEADGSGYMPPVSAAQWVATRGGEEAFDPEDREVWRRALPI